MYRDALMESLDPQIKPKNGNTGITGGVPGIQPDPGTLAPEPLPEPAAPKPSFGLSGYDMGKLNDPTHNTEKYQIGRVQQQFDPSAGITPEFLAALNAMDIGDFSGSGDRLSVKNSRNGSRFTDGTGDVIQNYTGDGPKNWTFLDTAEQAPQAQAQSPMALPAQQGLAPISTASKAITSRRSWRNLEPCRCLSHSHRHRLPTRRIRLPPSVEVSAPPMVDGYPRAIPTHRRRLLPHQQAQRLQHQRVRPPRHRDSPRRKRAC